MKKLFSAVIALTMLISAMNVNVFASNIEFSDTAGHWAENAMRMHVAESLVEIIKNKEQSIVDVPEISVVKDELNKTFKDADYENLYANHGTIPENVRRMFEYTYLAKKLDIMQGDTDGYYRPYDNVTRAELITMLDRIIAK